MTVERTYQTANVHGDDLTDDEQAWLDEHRNDLKLEPTAGNNWKTPESREHWGGYEGMRELQRARDEAEWRSVFSDDTDREAAIIHVTNQNRDTWLERIGEHDLHYRPIRHVEPYDGFAHSSHTHTTPDDPERITYATISNSADAADKMHEAETELKGEDRHQTVGGLLGFPQCCRDWFMDVWLDDYYVDPMYESACNSDCAETIDGNPEHVHIPEPEPLVNPLWRYFGWTLLTHMPCSFDCEGSAEVAQARGEVLVEHGMEDAARRLYDWLAEPLTWSGLLGQMRVSNRHMLGYAGTSQYWTEKRIVWGREPGVEFRG